MESRPPGSPLLLYHRAWPSCVLTHEVSALCYIKDVYYKKKFLNLERIWPYVLFISEFTLALEELSVNKNKVMYINNLTFKGVVNILVITVLPTPS